jgi:hypothetical protein
MRGQKSQPILILAEEERNALNHMVSCSRFGGATHLKELDRAITNMLPVDHYQASCFLIHNPSTKV